MPGGETRVNRQVMARMRLVGGIDRLGFPRRLHVGNILVRENGDLVLPNAVVGFLKQLMFLDGIGRSLDPDYDLFTDAIRLLEASLAAA